jgi:FlaA1/EpsC-like NDP-sugar epimerase
VFEQYHPNYVFHAAVYKHVPIIEAFPHEALQSNVVGTWITARLAGRFEAEKFVLVSTDKAINPTSIMGATKRMAEMASQSLYESFQNTDYIVTRFGNVLGSNGSVVPLFQKQIQEGGPVTITHPEMQRYFMTIPEAAQLVVEAGLMGQGGEIFVLDMGEPVKIVDLALDMIKLSGFEQDDIKIEFTGLRPGEKLFEELLADDEHSLPTPHPKLRIAKARAFNAELLPDLLAWIHTLENKNEGESIKAVLGWHQE